MRKSGCRRSEGESWRVLLMPAMVGGERKRTRERKNENYQVTRVSFALAKENEKIYVSGEEARARELAFGGVGSDGMSF